jgi:hypothetical protein
MPMSKPAVAIITAVITATASIGSAWITAQRGLISFPNPELQQQVKDLRQKLESRSKLTGDFEWQWAGDNWLGSVKFQNLADGTTSAVMETRFVKPDPKTKFQTLQDTLAFKSAAEGTANVSGQSMISLHLPVTVSPEFLKSHHTGSRSVILDAELQPVDAFAGQVRFIGDETATGDMILVRYRSNVRRW